MSKARLIGATVVAGLVFGSAAANAATITTPAGPLLVDGTGFSVSVSGGAGGGSASISFDLLGYVSLDGDNSFQDDFVLSLNGTDIYRGTFDLGGGHAVSGSTILLNTAGLLAGPISPTPLLGGAPTFVGGSLSISGLITLLAGNNTIGFRYVPVGINNGAGQSLADEGWAVNNLNVSAIPVPPAAVLLLTGLAGAAAMRRRRKTKT
jgi:hypothetical protein